MHTPLTRFECTPPFGCLIAHPCWSIVFECTPLLKSLNAHTLFKNWYELLFKAVNAKKKLRIYNTPRCNHLNAHPQEIWDEDPTTNLEDNPIWNWKYSHICPVRSNWRWTSRQRHCRLRRCLSSSYYHCYWPHVRAWLSWSERGTVNP